MFERIPALEYWVPIIGIILISALVASSVVTMKKLNRAFLTDGAADTAATECGTRGYPVPPALALALSVKNRFTFIRHAVIV